MDLGFRSCLPTALPHSVASHSSCQPLALWRSESRRVSLLFRILYGSHFTQSRTKGLPQNQQGFPTTCPFISCHPALLLLNFYCSHTEWLSLRGSQLRLHHYLDTFPSLSSFCYCPCQTPRAFLSVPVMGWSNHFPSFLYVPSVVGYILQVSIVSLLLQRATAGWEASVCSSRHQGPVGGCCSWTASGAAGVHPVPAGRGVF